MLKPEFPAFPAVQSHFFPCWSHFDEINIRFDYYNVNYGVSCNFAVKTCLTSKPLSLTSQSKVFSRPTNQAALLFVFWVFWQGLDFNYPWKNTQTKRGSRERNTGQKEEEEKKQSMRSELITPPPLCIQRWLNKDLFTQADRWLWSVTVHEIKSEWTCLCGLKFRVESCL